MAIIRAHTEQITKTTQYSDEGHSIVVETLVKVSL